MYIEQIDLLNIRSYKTASLKFSKGINLILGSNNSGKSTILRSLQKLQVGLMGINYEDIRKTEDFGKIHTRISGIEKDEHYLFQPKSSRVVVGKSQSIIFSLWSDKSEGITDKALQVNADKMNISLSERNIDVTQKSGEKSVDDDFSDFKGFPGKENENNLIYPFLAKRKTSHFNTHGGRDAAYGISEQLYNLPSRIQNLINDTHPFSEKYKQYSKDILEFAPGKVPGVGNANEDKLGIFVRQQDNIYIESMGDGVANILGLLAVLLTDDNKVFLIEELENDIHPQALKKLLDLIIEKADHKQFPP